MGQVSDELGERRAAKGEEEETDLFRLRVAERAVLERQEALRPLALLDLELDGAGLGRRRVRASL